MAVLKQEGAAEQGPRAPPSATVNCPTHVPLLSPQTGPESLSLTVGVDPGGGTPCYSCAGDEAVHIGAPGPHIQQLEGDPAGPTDVLASLQSGTEAETLWQGAAAAAVEPH